MFCEDGGLGTSHLVDCWVILHLYTTMDTNFTWGLLSIPSYLILDLLYYNIVSYISLHDHRHPSLSYLPIPMSLSFVHFGISLTDFFHRNGQTILLVLWHCNWALIVSTSTLRFDLCLFSIALSDEWTFVDLRKQGNWVRAEAVCDSEFRWK